MSRTNVDNFESERFVKKLAILRTIRSDLETLSRPHLASLRQTLFPCWCGWLFNSKAQELFDEGSICRYDIGVSFIYKMCSQLPHLSGVNKVCNCADPGFPKRDCVVRSTYRCTSWQLPSTAYFLSATTISTLSLRNLYLS